jgi:hypothetical protein
MSRKGIEKKRKGIGKKVLGTVIAAVTVLAMATILTAGQAANIEIIRPNATDCWWGVHNITWNSTGVNTVNIYYSSEDGAPGSWEPIKENYPSSGANPKEYPWDTATVNDSCKACIRITGQVGAGYENGYGYGYGYNADAYGYGWVSDDSEQFVVDNMGARQTVEFGEPKIENAHGSWPGIGTNTPVWINATNRFIQGNKGAKNLTYQEWWGPIGGPLQFIEEVTVEDNDGNDTNPTVGNISVVIYKEESCWHELDYYCYDYCGRRAPAEPNEWNATDFIVDADEPTTTVEFSGPMFNDYGEYTWMGNCTTKWINVTDSGCIPGGTGVAKIDWWIDGWVGHWTPKSNGTVYDNDANDSNPTKGEISMKISIHQDCLHRIRHKATDKVGNVETELKQVHYVDVTPPDSNLTYGGCYNITGQGYVAIGSEQNITINVNNTGTEPCIYPYNITTYWRVYFNDSGTWKWYPDPATGSDVYDGNHNTSFWKGVWWYNYTKPIKFHEECVHYLEYFSKDPLCNTEETQNVTFHVIDTIPPIVTVIYPNGGETVSGTVDIQWSATDNIDIYLDIKIEYSNDSGITWNTIVASTENDGHYDWNTNGLNCSLFLIRVNATDDAGNIGSDTSDSAFTVDNAPPEISDVKATPSSQLPNGWVNITCNVTDNVAVDEVYFNVTYPDGSYENFSIEQNKTGNIYCCNRTYGQIGTYNYFIWANDTSGNWNASDVYHFEITPVYITTLEKGWNLFSLPFNYSITIGQLCIIYDETEYNWTRACDEGIIYGVIYDWNRTGQHYEYLWKLTDTLKPGYGYWIICYVEECELWFNRGSSGTVEVSGDNITTLEEHWNLFGLPFNYSITIGQLRFIYDDEEYNWTRACDESIIYGVIYDWNRTEQRYHYLYHLTDILKPGYGFWIFCYKECEIRYNPSP